MMRIRTVGLAMTLAIALALTLSPSASEASKVVGGAGILTKVDAEKRTITVRKHVIKVSRRSSVYDKGGRRIDLEELATLTGDEVQFTAYRVGRQLLLKRLEIGIDDD